MIFCLESRHTNITIPDALSVFPMDVCNTLKVTETQEKEGLRKTADTVFGGTSVLTLRCY